VHLLGCTIKSVANGGNVCGTGIFSYSPFGLNGFAKYCRCAGFVSRAEASQTGAIFMEIPDCSGAARSESIEKQIGITNAIVAVGGDYSCAIKEK
jgi:hypothetical protein